MAFNQETGRIAEDIGTLVVILKTNPEDPDQPQTANFWLLVQMSDGTTKKVAGDLVPHITTAQRTGLMDFMASLRTQAEGEVLP